MSDAPYLVLGGTGFLGRRIVRRLLEDGRRVRIAARRPDRAGEFAAAARAETVQADLRAPETLQTALEGTAGAVNATSLYLETADLSFETIHVEGAARFAALARRAGTRRLAHLSGIGARPEARDPYIRARGRGEAAVREAFPDAAMMRPSAMYGEGDAFLGAILATLRRLPVQPLFGDGGTRLQPIHVDDAARAIASALQADRAEPRYDLSGPRVRTYWDLLHDVAEAAGLRARTVPVPFPLWRALAAVAERLPGAPLTRTQVALMEEDNVAGEGIPGPRDLGVAPRDVTAFVRFGLASGALPRG